MHMDHSTATQAHQAAHPHDQHNTLESILMCPQTQQHLGGGGERKPSRAHQQQPQEAIKCPRCQSTNTKFCYYNNYSLAQPRYFCKSCRRYWTKGGTLRNVPVGGGCRRNRRPSSSSSSSSLKRTTATAAAAAAAYHDDHHDHQDPFTATPFPMIVSGGQLGFHGPQHDFAASYYSNGHHHSDDDAAALQYCIPGGFLESLMIKNGDDLLFRGFADQQMSGATIGAAATTTAAMFYNKQEPPSSSPSPPSSSPSAEGERSGGRVLLGCPWQLINGVGEHSDSYGSSLGSFSSPNWYGLLNSPLM